VKYHKESVEVHHATIADLFDYMDTLIGESVGKHEEHMEVSNPLKVLMIETTKAQQSAQAADLSAT